LKGRVEEAHKKNPCSESVAVCKSDVKTGPVQHKKVVTIMWKGARGFGLRRERLAVHEEQLACNKKELAFHEEQVKVSVPY
jgi:hypothetical protein